MAAGDAIRIGGDELEVVVLPGLGCRLHRLRAFGQDLLRTPDDPAAHADDPFFWGAYVMAPWTNRASAEPTKVAGRLLALPANFLGGTAIHGQVFARAWAAVAGGFAVRGGGSDDPWPWPYEVSASHAVEGSRLRLAYVLVNRSGERMPAGIGLHAWFSRPVEVGLRARAVHPRNDDPDVAEQPAVGSFGLSLGEALPVGLDATWLDVAPREVSLRWPEAGIAATMSVATGGELHVAVASPEATRAVAVEPVTHRPWGLRRSAEGRDGGMPLLDPGAAVTLEIGLAFTRLG